MKIKFLAAAFIFTLNASLFSTAQAQELDLAGTEVGTEVIGEMDPFDPDIENELRLNDLIYGDGTDFYFEENDVNLEGVTAGCRRQSCQVWAYVNRASQTITIYLNGERQGTWPVSTGTPGRGTPAFDKNPNGRIYDRYTSRKFPGGDYKGLGNMPYAVFISGGFAIHGTPEGNWRYLGVRASHGCIRVHPQVGYMFNRAVRRAGISNSWITVD